MLVKNTYCTGTLLQVALTSSKADSQYGYFLLSDMFLYVGGQSVIGVHKRKPWSEEEKMAVDFHFRGFFEDQKLPGKQDIEAVIELEPVLRGRTWQNIKDYCRNVHFGSYHFGYVL